MNENLLAAGDAVARAKALVDLRRYEEALEQLGLALARSPGDTEAQCLRTLCLLQLERMEEALGSAEDAVASAPTSEWALRLLAVAHLNNFDAEAAADAAYRAVAAAPWLAAAYAVLMEAELERGHLDAAEDAARRAMTVEPGASIGHVALGKVMLRRHQWREAEAQIRTALEIDPEDYEAVTLLGLVLRHRFRFLKALSVQAAAAQMNAAHPASRQNIVRTLWAMIIVASLVIAFVARILWGPASEWVGGLAPKGQVIVLTAIGLSAIGLVGVVVRIFMLLPMQVKAVVSEAPRVVSDIGREIAKTPQAISEIAREAKKAPGAIAAGARDWSASRRAKPPWVPSGRQHVIVGVVFGFFAAMAVAGIEDVGTSNSETAHSVGETVGLAVAMTIIAVLAGAVFVLGSRRRVAAGFLPTRWSLILRAVFALTVALFALAAFSNLADEEYRARDGVFSLAVWAAFMIAIACRAWLAFVRAFSRRRQQGIRPPEAPTV
jgi:Flp pilus assembly protein TadD